MTDIDQPGGRIGLSPFTALLAATLGGGVGSMLLGRASNESYLEVLGCCVLVAAGLASVKLARDNCFGSRLVTALLAGCSIAGQVLVCTVGAPGRAPSPWSAPAVAVIVLALAILVALVVDARTRATVDPEERPYAL